MAEAGGRAAALRDVEARFSHWSDVLIGLSRIPSVSAAGFPAKEVRRSAEATADILREASLENVAILEVEGAHPAVYADWLHRPGAPTLLLYGHHDVVPPGRPGEWRTPPFEPALRKGRLYGRGTADDKGGFLAHVAAVAAWLRTGGLPLNVRFLVEGEEEIGSPNLPRFLEAYRDRLQADALVLSDTSNFDTGVPALTYQLRGLVQVDVEVQCLERPVHSGQKGGAVPDPVQILSRILASLTKKDGSLDVPGLYARVKRPTRAQLARLRALPFDEARFRRDSGLLKGTRLAGEARFSVYERLWMRPSLTVIAFEASAIQGSSNQILDAVRARLSLRIVPDMDGAEAGRQLVRRLTKEPPFGARVSARIVRHSAWWRTEPEGPAFDAARQALSEGFGQETVLMGSGGSIGFVQPFSDFLQGAPALLMGVEDPPCNAHSENESLHMGDWKKVMLSAVRLYAALAHVPFAPRKKRG